MTARKGTLCGARKRQGSGACTQPAGWGTSHVGYGRCKLHGGCAPSGRESALNQQAAAELARLDVAAVGNPLEQLAMLAGQAIAWKDAMAARVNELTSIRYEADQGGEQLRSEVALWERALDRCEKFLTAMARLDIDNRLAKINEEQGNVIVSFIIAALRKFGIDFQDETTHAIVMTLFDQLVRGEEAEIVQAAIEPSKQEMSYACEADAHGKCMAYTPSDYSPDPPPWPQRCPCNCHDPARATVYDLAARAVRDGDSDLR